MFVWALLCALAPGVWLFNRTRSRWAPAAPRNFMMWHLFAGAAVGVPAIVIENLIQKPLLRLVPSEFSVFATAFIVAALVEEGLKVVAIKAAVDRARDHALDSSSTFAAGMMVGLGFAVAETCLYAISRPNAALWVSLSRYLSAVPLHFFNGVIFTAAYVATQRGLRNDLGWVFFVIVVAHGIYDFALMRPGAETMLVPVILLSLWFYSRWELGRVG